jgi:hypothetical protein
LRPPIAKSTYLRYPPNVLIAVLLRKPQILVQPKAHIVAVQTVRREPKVQKVLLERSRDGRLSGCGEPGEPDGETLLLAGCVALCAREGRVPGDVAGGELLAMFACDGGVWWGSRRHCEV